LGHYRASFCFQNRCLGAIYGVAWVWARPLSKGRMTASAPADDHRSDAGRGVEAATVFWPPCRSSAIAACFGDNQRARGRSMSHPSFCAGVTMHQTGPTHSPSRWPSEGRVARVFKAGSPLANAAFPSPVWFASTVASKVAMSETAIVWPFSVAPRPRSRRNRAPGPAWGKNTTAAVIFPFREMASEWKPMCRNPSHKAALPCNGINDKEIALPSRCGPSSLSFGHASHNPDGPLSASPGAKHRIELQVRLGHGGRPRRACPNAARFLPGEKRSHLAGSVRGLLSGGRRSQAPARVNSRRQARTAHALRCAPWRHCRRWIATCQQVGRNGAFVDRMV